MLLPDAAVSGRRLSNAVWRLEIAAARRTAVVTLTRIVWVVIVGVMVADLTDVTAAVNAPTPSPACFVMGGRPAAAATVEEGWRGGGVISRLLQGRLTLDLALALQRVVLAVVARGRVVLASPDDGEEGLIRVLLQTLKIGEI